MSLSFCGRGVRIPLRRLTWEALDLGEKPVHEAEAVWQKLDG